MLGSVNYLAILGAAVAATSIGAFWYSPAGFGSAWIKAQGFSRKEVRKLKKKGVGKSMAIAVVMTLVMAFVLENLLGVLGASTVPHGAQVAFWLWLGFTLPVIMGAALWEGKPWNLVFINGAHYLASLIVMGAILAVW